MTDKTEDRISEIERGGREELHGLDFQWLLSELRKERALRMAAEKVVEAAAYIGTEHSAMCATVACNCSGHAKRRVVLSRAVDDYAELKGE